MARNVFGAGVKFSVDNAGQVNRQQQQIKKGFLGIRTSANQAALASTRLNVNTLTVAESFNILQAKSDALSRAGKSILSGFLTVGTELATAGSQLEQTRKLFTLAFKDQEVANKNLIAAQKVAAQTNLDTIQTLDSVVKFQRLGVDSLKEYTSEWVENGKIVTGQVGTLQLIADLINGSGQASSNVFRNLSIALKGQLINFSALFDGAEELSEKAAFNAAKTAQERMDVILQTTNRLFGGISKSTEGTFGFIIDNLGDVFTILKATVGEQILPILTPFAQKLLDFLSALGENKKFLDAMVIASKNLAGIVLPIAEALLSIAQSAVDFAATNPELFKSIVAYVALKGVLLIILGAIGTLLATVGLFVSVVLPAIKVGIALFIGALGTISVALIKIAAIVGVVIAIAKLIRVAYEENFGGLKDVIDKTILAIKAIIEITKNWSDGTSKVSKETAENLQKAGISDTVIKIGGFVGSMVDMFQRMGRMLVDTLGPIWEAVKPGFQEMFGFFVDLVSLIGEFFTILFTDSADALDGTKKDLSGFQSVLNTVVFAFKMMGNIMKSVFRIARATVIPFLRDEMEDGAETVGDIASALEFVGEAANSASNIYDKFLSGLEDTGLLIDLFISDPWETAIGVFKSGIEVITGAFTSMWDTLKTNVWDPFLSILNTIIDKISGLSDLLPDIDFFDDISNFFSFGSVSDIDTNVQPTNTLFSSLTDSLRLDRATESNPDVPIRSASGSSGISDREQRQMVESLSKLAESFTGNSIQQAFESALNNVSDRDPIREMR